MNVLFIGETWQGSSARSLREALATQSSVMVSDIGQDHYLPTYQTLLLRLTNRFLRVFQLNELENAIRKRIDALPPDAVVIYKGSTIRRSFVEEIKRRGLVVINVFPDCSPHAHGRRLRDAIGCYDLVISAKPFHPEVWKSIYGYQNACVCVPHGYDPNIHLWTEPAPSHTYDVAVCCAWRPKYHRLMLSFAHSLVKPNISVAVAGPGWVKHRDSFPKHWIIEDSKTGRMYGEFLRSARIAVAPVNREMVVQGVTQPGDEDTTRTYELAAAYCFFLHQRTKYVETLYDEHSEVPLWNDAIELADLVERWLPDESRRRSFASRAHARAVPQYSIPNRADRVRAYIEQSIKARNGSFTTE